MLVTDLVNVRYLSGFTGSNAALLVFADDRGAVLATDGRYRTQAAQQAPDAEVAIERAVGRYLAGRAATAGVRRLGFESHVVTVDAYAALAGALAEGSTELMCHPGRCGDALRGERTRLKESRERELEALIAPEVRAAAERNGVELIGYTGLR